MDEVKTGERLAVLETRFDSFEADRRDRDEAFETILSKFEELDKELSRYRGIVGGILFVVTAVVTFAKLFAEQVIGFFTK